MAIRDVVLDPDGDILVIVPSTLPEEPSEHPGPYEPVTEKAEIQETAAATEESASNGISTDEEYQPEAVEESAEDHPPEPEEEEQWRFKASSKHLALASTFVKKMTTGPWREATEIHDDGLLHWNFDGFDATAISTILSIIHGLNRRVPRTVDLSMLAQIARVVDYLDCHEVMELYASIWVNHLGESTPGSSKKDWDSWISITGVFQNPAIFQDWTRVAIVEKLNCPPSLELPILSQAYDKIDQWRQLHLDKILSCVYDHVDRLSEHTTCSVECDAVLLGTLIRRMRANSLPSLRPTRPYEGLSVSSVVKAIKGLSVPDWCLKMNGIDEPTQSPWEFWGAGKKIIKTHQKKAKLKTKRKGSSSVDWGFGEQVEEIEEMREVVVVEHSCGFDELIATINKLESEIKGLDLKTDLGIQYSE
ncbi:hypothetical protein F4782DRAFT_531192 [Xylaria castorea]|nr:hypothetical protein F4782DRAFT_531192 [Xylaria castorea]